jgi:hypothetical protein
MAVSVKSAPMPDFLRDSSDKDPNKRKGLGVDRPTFFAKITTGIVKTRRRAIESQPDRTL